MKYLLLAAALLCFYPLTAQANLTQRFGNELSCNEVRSRANRSNKDMLRLEMMSTNAENPKSVMYIGYFQQQLWLLDFFESDLMYLRIHCNAFQ